MIQQKLNRTYSALRPKKKTTDISIEILHTSPTSWYDPSNPQPPTIKVSLKSDKEVYATLDYKREDGQQSSTCGSLYSSLCTTSSDSSTKSREHAFEFSRLTIGATYSYTIKISGAGDFTKTGTFKATDPNDTTPPSLNIEAKIQSDNAVPIIWGDKAFIKIESNELSQFKVETSVKSDLSDATAICNNLNDRLFGFGSGISCEVKNLSREVEYFYRVTARDPAGNIKISSTLSFTIPPESAN